MLLADALALPSSIDTGHLTLIPRTAEQQYLELVVTDCIFSSFYNYKFRITTDEM